MKRSLYYYPLAVVIVAIILALFGWFAESTAVRWVALSFGLALIASGLGLYSFLISLHTERTMIEMSTALARIESLQEEIRKDQKEGTSSGTPIVASLEAMTQYYIDYINKQKGEDKK